MKVKTKLFFETCCLSAAFFPFLLSPPSDTHPVREFGVRAAWICKESILASLVVVVAVIMISSTSTLCRLGYAVGRTSSYIIPLWTDGLMMVVKVSK